MLVFFAAFAVSLVATPLMRWLALRYGVVDRPDHKRKAHSVPVAYLGGLAIFLGWIAGIIVSHRDSTIDFPLCIVVGAGVITLVGLLDDIYGINPRVKVGGQLFAAAALASRDMGIQLAAQIAGLCHLDVPARISLDPTYLATLSHSQLYTGIGVYAAGAMIVALFVLGGCNALNLLDGLDGLAAGVTAISCIGFLFIAIQATIMIAQNSPDIRGANLFSDPVRIVMCLAILGSVLGFLLFNFNPASIFMGDAGSLLLGFLCVSTILLFAHTAAAGLKFVTAALIVFAVPITDTTLAIVRRKLRGQNIFSADNQHLHHQIFRAYQRLNLSRGATVKLAVLTIYGLSALFAALGCAMVFPRWRYALVVFCLLFGSIVVAAYKAGYHDLPKPAADPAASPVPDPHAPSLPRHQS
jgi:UDP-GlcNAc:undecaprenyl-phosphate GlcNAc-1-phosphate transferase